MIMTTDTKRKNLSEENKIELALERFSPMEYGGKPTSLEYLSKKYKRAVPVISRAINEAINKRWVVIRVTRTKEMIPIRVKSLEEKLIKTFPDLRIAIVVDFQKEDSHENHKALGISIAEFLYKNLQLLIEDGDVIGVGSGRGPYYTVSSLARFTKNNKILKKEVTLISLTGIISPQAPTSQSIELLFDSDQCIRDLSACFSGPIILKEISFPVAHDNLNDIITRTWLNSRDFQEHTPRYAIVGVGVLKEQHRFLLDVKAINEGKEGSKILEPVRKDMKELVSIVAKYDPSPVADICNRLFYVNSVPVKPDDKNRIQYLIDCVNRKLLTVSWEQLQKIRNVILVAGTKAKALAIHQILKEPLCHVGILCTDSVTAKAIIDAEKNYL